MPSKIPAFADFRTPIFRHRRGVHWITQAALGAILGEWLLGHRLGKSALAWGAAIGLLPELELLGLPFIDHAHAFAFRHGPFHSLLAIALLSFGIGYGLERLWKKSFKIPRAQIAGCVLAIGCTHLLADCLTPQGAMAIWPFSSQRIAFSFLDGNDPFFAAPVAIAVLWLTCLTRVKVTPTKGNKKRPKFNRRKISLGGIGLSAGYALLAVTMKFTVSAGFDADLKRRGATYERRMAMPVPHQIFLWRTVIDRGDEFWVGYRSVFEFMATPVRWTVFLKNREALSTVANLKQTTTLTESMDGWWLARPTVKGAWLGDIRGVETRTWGAKKGTVDSTLKTAFAIDATAKGDPVQPISGVPGGARDSLRRTFGRIFGDHEAWEGNPRLAGVTGSLPEFLPVEE